MRNRLPFVYRGGLVATVIVTLSAAAALSARQQTPVFRTRVEIVQLDVSVLDKNRHPVRGLTQDDFTILDEGQPRKIVGFTAFDIADNEAPTAGWMRDVPPDVTDNALKPESRLFVIVIDDALIPQDPAAIRDTKKILASVIEKLSATDLTAIVFTGDNRKTQDFTGDKTKLLAALDNLNPGLAMYRFGLDAAGVETDLYFFQSSVRVLGSIAEYLRAVPARRKALLWVSPGVPMDLAGAVPTDSAGCPSPAPWDPVLRQCTAGTNELPPLICLTGPGTCTTPDHPRPAGVWGTRFPPYAMSDLRKRIDDTFRDAQRSNVTIYPIDPTGLAGQRYYLQQRLGADNQGFAAHKATTQLDFLIATAANTGGHAVVNTNDFEPGITDVFAENSSYYLISFEAPDLAPDGKLHRLDVKVNRSGVDVRTRSGFYAPKPEASETKDAKNVIPPEQMELAKAIGGLLPTSDLPMKVAVAPFAVPGQRLSTVAVVLGVRQPIPDSARNGRTTETTELQTSAFTPEGDPRGTQRHTARVTLRPGSDGEAAYEVLGRIDLTPGRYRLRLAAHNATSSKSGSVFADVIVPDYSDAAVSATPIVLSASPGRASAPRDLLAPFLPFVPTADRSFARSDRVTALLRVYQNGRKAILPAAAAIRIVDAGDRLVMEEKQTIEGDRFRSAAEQLAAATPETIAVRPPPPVPSRAVPTPAPIGDQFANMSLRSADISIRLPLARLAPGAHLLTIEVTAGDVVLRRDIRFDVRED